MAAIVKGRVDTGHGVRLVAEVTEGGDLTKLNDLGNHVFRFAVSLDGDADMRGNQAPGFLPQLTGLLGDGSFDAGMEEHRFDRLLTSGVPLARAFLSTWNGLQAEVAVDVGLLRTLARGAGHESCMGCKETSPVSESGHDFKDWMSPCEPYQLPTCAMLRG